MSNSNVCDDKTKEARGGDMPKECASEFIVLHTLLDTFYYYSRSSHFIIIAININISIFVVIFILFPLIFHKNSVFRICYIRYCPTDIFEM